MKKINAEKMGNITVISILTTLAVMLTTMLVADASTTPKTEMEVAAVNIATYTPEYMEAIEQIAEEYGVNVRDVAIHQRMEYSVKTVDYNLDYADPGKKSVEVYYLCVDSVETPIYAGEQYLLSGDMFVQTPEDIMPAVNSNIAGYSGEELAGLRNDWLDKQCDNYFSGASKMFAPEFNQR